MNLSFGGKSPRVAEDAFIAPTAVLIGHSEYQKLQRRYRSKDSPPSGGE